MRGSISQKSECHSHWMPPFNLWKWFLDRRLWASGYTPSARWILINYQILFEKPNEMNWRENIQKKETKKKRHTHIQYVLFVRTFNHQNRTKKINKKKQTNTHRGAPNENDRVNDETCFFFLCCRFLLLNLCDCYDNMIRIKKKKRKEKNDMRRPNRNWNAKMVQIGLGSHLFWFDFYCLGCLRPMHVYLSFSLNWLMNKLRRRFEGIFRHSNANGRVIWQCFFFGWKWYRRITWNHGKYSRNGGAFLIVCLCRKGLNWLNWTISFWKKALFRLLTQTQSACLLYLVKKKNKKKTKAYKLWIISFILRNPLWFERKELFWQLLKIPGWVISNQKKSLHPAF